MQQISNFSLLKDLLVLTKDGEWGRSEPTSDSIEMYIIRGTDFAAVRYGNLSNVPIRYISEKIAERKSLQPNDILIETAGGTKEQPTGRTVFLKPQIFEKASLPITCASFSRFLRVNPQLAVPEYIYWYLQFLYHTGKMEQHQIQHTGVARFQYTRFAQSVNIPLPLYSTQQRIAEILSNYDRLIDNNNRRIALLEESIHQLYKEWFVHLRFPGYESVKVVDSIPDGWSRVEFGEALILQRGFDLPSKNRKSGDVPVYASTGINGFHDTPKVKAPGVVTGRSGTVGSVMYVQKHFWPLNTTLWVKEFKKVTPPFAYCLLSQMDLNSYQAGAAVPTLNRNVIHEVKILLPSEQLQHNFDNFANSILIQIEILKKYNYNLRQARDLLLPRLMNGSIAV